MEQNNKDNQQESHEHDDETQTLVETPSSLPILARLDRIDRLMQFVEERQNGCCCCGRSMRSGSKCSTKLVEEDNNNNNNNVILNKTLSSAMEEVHHKGTLMERLELLENRFLQLWVEVDQERLNALSSTFTPSSSTTMFSENENEPSTKTITSTSTSTSTIEDGHSEESRIAKRRLYARQLLRKKKWFHFTMGC